VHGSVLGALNVYQRPRLCENTCPPISLDGRIESVFSHSLDPYATLTTVCIADLQLKAKDLEMPKHAVRPIGCQFDCVLIRGTQSLRQP
jgi:hypothetical protein